MYKERSYRNWVKPEGLVSFEVRENETDLLISADKNLEKKAREAVLNYRNDLEGYISENKQFLTSLKPVTVSDDAPLIVKAMAGASAKAGVGPMAAVAGALAEFVGRELAKFSEEVIVENGGDIFLRSSKNRVLGVYAGEESPFTGKLAVELPPSEKGIGVSTSSGTVSHSLSFGRADAALVISEDAALADAAATAACNTVKNTADIEKGINFAKSIDGVKGILIIIKDKFGSWGEVRLV